MREYNGHELVKCIIKHITSQASNNSNAKLELMLTSYLHKLRPLRPP